MKLDQYDRRLLDLLQADASLSVAELAEKIGVSKSACWRRVKRLEDEGVISERVTLLDQHQLNLPVTVYLLLRTSQHNEKWAGQFQKVVSGIPQILEVCRMSGELDYLVKAVVPDMKGYDDLYKKMIKADLFDVSASFVMEEIKSTTRLPLDFVQR